MDAVADRHHLFKKLHTFSGAVALGGFLCVHLWANLHAIEGAAAFNAEVRYLEHLPGLLAIEVVLIWLPLFYHAIYGVVVMRISRLNTRRYGYFRNWMFTLQRVTGAVAFVFIGYHFWEFRLANYFYGRPIDFGVVAADLRDPWMQAFYIAGVLSVVYHFANGLWSFGVDWGLLIGRRAQRQFTWVSALIFVVLGTMGVSAVYAFAR